MDINGHEITIQSEDEAEITAITDDVRREMASIWEIASQSLSKEDEMRVTEHLKAILSHTEDLVSLTEANLETMHAFKNAALDFRMQRDMVQAALRDNINKLAQAQMITSLTKMVQVQFDMVPRDAEWIAQWIMGTSPFYVSSYDSDDLEFKLKEIVKMMWDQAAESPEILHEDNDNE